MIAWILAVLVIVWILASLYARAKDAGHRRCAYCQSVLKFGNVVGGQLMRHADVCRRCGRVQPWAPTPKG